MYLAHLLCPWWKHGNNRDFRSADESTKNYGCQVSTMHMPKEQIIWALATCKYTLQGEIEAWLLLEYKFNALNSHHNFGVLA